MDMEAITKESLETLAKAAATQGVNSGTGLVGVDLQEIVSLIPVPATFYDQLPKTNPKMGAKFTEWKALVNVNNTQPDPATPFDYAAPLSNIQEQDVTALYGKIGQGYTVTWDSIDFGKGYADAKSIAVFNSLNQYKIGADRKGLYGCNFSLGTPSAPTVTPVASGGSIPASTPVPVRVAARTGSGYYYYSNDATKVGSTAASATTTATTAAGAGNSAVATVASIPGAVCYDWFVNGFYYTTTTTNKVTITAIPTAHAAAPVAQLPGLSSTAPNSVPATDRSANVNDFNGLLATLAGDYATGGATGLVQRGNGLNSGASFTSLDGNPFTVNGQAVKELDTLNMNIWNTIFQSPTAYMMSAQEASSISGAILQSPAASTLLQPNGTGERQDIVAGGFVGWYINKAAGGVPVKIEVHPNLAPGTLIARTDRLPLPNSNITNTLELRNLHDVTDYVYASARNAGVAGGGPREDGEVYSMSTLVNRAPVAMGVIQNIAAS
jgi:hypothetical protein